MLTERGFREAKRAGGSELDLHHVQVPREAQARFMIEAKNVTKSYGATVAVDNVSFTAQPGEIVGFLGPNGAGKSTTLKILTCYIVADSGTVTVAGHDVLENALDVRRSIGSLPENTPLYADMRVLDFLKFVARSRQVAAKKMSGRLDEVIGLTGIKPMLKKAIGHLSKGYRQRVGLAQALIHDPPILIFDEPTSGLDPHQIIEIRNLIRELGKTKLILFSSHIMQEISAICTRIMVIKDGRMVANGTPQELMRSVVGGAVFRVRLKAAGEAAGGDLSERLRGIEGVIEARQLESSGDDAWDYHVLYDGSADIGPQLFALAKDSGWELSRLVAAESSLEEVYLQLTAA